MQVVAIELNTNLNRIYAATHGRGVYSAEITSTTGVATRDRDAGVPERFKLAQNYPNPFWSEATSRSAGNPETSIRYELPYNGNVTLAVFDLTGRQVALLESGLKTAGQHFVRWNGLDNAGNRVANGVYFYRLEAASPDGAAAVLTKKMTVMK
ncbi:MAG: FlgD immunoglobulin-like domain containing protein [bacterium]